MLNLFTRQKTKTVNERAYELQNESMGIVKSFSDMISKLKEVNDKIEADKQKASNERDLLNDTINQLELTKKQNEAIASKIENIIS